MCPEDRDAHRFAKLLLPHARRQDVPAACGAGVRSGWAESPLQVHE